ncbi:MAG: mannitol dehydrogenase family protein [SAR324 cluster bacterium]|nr:mannitol dehydrogenase family protein [SAR324 cluster bacterium]
MVEKNKTLLSRDTLKHFNNSIDKPLYKIDDLKPGIIHIGTGNFHRAHQGLYMNDLFNLGEDRDWAIIGSGVMPHDAMMREALQKQDYLSTIVELEPNANQARISGSMIDFLPVDENNTSLVKALQDPSVRIVSLTITEGGYFMAPATGEFNPEHPQMVADSKNLESSTSVFGALVQALKQRRQAGIPPFTVMSCDNLPGNGKVSKDAVVGLAELNDSELARWIEKEVAFPNGMVDRIATVTSDQQRQKLLEDFGIQDQWPVFCEPYRQWVLEDSFSMGRPSFEKVGVTFTENITAFELMKLRILNGGHAAIAYPGALLDIHFVHDAMTHELIQAYLAKLELEEIIPIVPPVPGIELPKYFVQIQERFSNPQIGDTIPRLCQEGSDRQPKFILPSIKDRLSKGLEIKGLALESAMWCRYCFGESETGKAINIDDLHSKRIQNKAQEARNHPETFLRMEDIFGDLGKNRVFKEEFASSLNSLWANGVEKTLKSYLESE